MHCETAPTYRRTPVLHPICYHFFFFNDTATTEIYTLSLHDALPISFKDSGDCAEEGRMMSRRPSKRKSARMEQRSEEHTSELQSRRDLVCRLLLEKKKNKQCDAILNTAGQLVSHVNAAAIATCGD